MAVNYGQVAIVPKGEWNVETQYKVNNLVSYDGSSYVAKVQPPVGTLPTDTSYWQVSAAGTKKATADSLGTVMPDGTTTSVGEDGKLSVNTAQQDALGVVKGSDDITVGEDGKMTLNTTFEQATELANIIAGEAIKSVLGKVSKAIATTMSLDENALLKNMISGIDVNDGNKVPSSAYIHSLVERIGMGTALEGGVDNLTAGLNSVNNNLSKYDRKKLNNGDNLNVKLGPYGSASNDTVGSLLNKPTQIVNGEVTIDWYPSNDASSYGTQILRHTRDSTINIYFRAKRGSVDNWSEWINLATKDDLDSKLELVTTRFLPLTAATINPNNYTDFTLNPSLPSGYILVGACLKDANALDNKVAPVYCNASSSNGTHRINFRLANISDDPVSITESMGVAFYLFVRKR